MTDMAMRLHVADEDVPIFTFSPPVKDAKSVDITYIFSEPIKVCLHFTGVIRVEWLLRPKSAFRFSKRNSIGEKSRQSQLNLSI